MKHLNLNKIFIFPCYCLNFRIVIYRNKLKKGVLFLRRTQKKQVTRVVAFLIISAIAVCSFTIFFQKDVRFAVDNCFERIKKNEIKNVTVNENIAVKSATLEELKAYPNITFNDSMILVNEDYRLNENYETDCVEYEPRDVTVNSCVVQPFTKLSNALLEKTGETLYISSALRSFERQKEIKLEKGDIAQNAGASEHQTGLAVDVYVSYYAGESFTKSESGQFINTNCDDYGFIIRYPVFGKVTTGISYEPWHLRYVGFPHAEIINNSFITYEQYVEYFEPNIFYEYEGYLISRQTYDEIKIPENFKKAVVSEDNTGHIFLTFEM